jgi:pimeloyl-ACP methyl ester carboxylesterase
VLRVLFLVTAATVELVPERCNRRMVAPPAPATEIRAAGSPSASDDGPTRMEELPGTSPPVYVLRGRREGSTPIVVLHGMCSHALGYAQSFQFSAANKGVVVAPQGDKPCGGPWASWSLDLRALDARIVAALEALGMRGPVRDVAVVGYSQGASRAEALARKYPERYSRLVLIAAPDAPSPRGLRRLRAAVMMAGARDRQDLMKEGASAFSAAGIPATFQVIAEARHGEMGPHPEQTMGAALDWAWEHARPDVGAPAKDVPAPLDSAAGRRD